MTRLPTDAAIHPLARNDGVALISGPQAILKAALEADREVSLIAGPRHGGFGEILAAASDQTTAPIIWQHGLTLTPVPHAHRAITLALHAANSGRAAIALVPNVQIDSCVTALTGAISSPVQNGGAVCIILEDRPQDAPASCPRQAAMRLAMPCIEPADVAELRDLIDHALRLSRVSASTVAIVVHSSILRSLQTLEMRPNRVLGPVVVDVVLSRRRRKPRWTESSGGRDIMRLSRRMELNRARAVPNPGERVPVGFITIGPSDPAVAHVADALHLHGRVPVLHLGLLQPIDEAAVSRLLTRCERVIVLEPRPATGTMRASVIALAESIRSRTSERTASVWGRDIPSLGGNGVAAMQQLDVDEALHPSSLARKVVHLLHMIRPTMQVASKLAPDPPEARIQAPPRGGPGNEIGTPAAINLLRRMTTDVDQWLRAQTAQLKERGIEPTTLAIDGVQPAASPTASSSASPRIVPVEFWSARQFLESGVAALRQAARDERPWIMLVCDFDVPDNQDLERLARSAIPSERAERVSIITANLDDRAGLRDRLEEAVLAQRLTVILVRDGPPPRFDVSAIERSLADIDRFGFQPRQRITWPAIQACLFTPPAEDEDDEDHEQTDRRELRTEVTVDQFARPTSGRVRIKVQPLLEQIEVIRTRPPAWFWRSGLPARLELPTPIHRKEPVWRAHVAGFRGFAPGVAALVLCEAGRYMGYEVASIHDATPIGPGRRAWTQIVFTRPRGEERTSGDFAAPVTRHSALPSAPYGEIDLLLGLDVHETIRAISPNESLRVAQPERTTAVVNRGAFTDEEERELSPSARDDFTASLGAVTREDHRIIEDYAAACRTWFYTDRVTDLAMLGVAFQRGLIPASLEAIETAVARMEERGYGRCREAFQFGRYLASEARLLTRPREESEDDLHQMIRRMALGLRGRFVTRWAGLSLADRFAGLVQRTLAAMPGLAETAPGRRAQRDLITAIYRAIEWGGFDYASRYAEVITSIYIADRGDTGRSLTRSAVLPLAEAMLIHDPIYIASMATNPEQRRRLRHRLNIKHARGDTIERRYLTRFELVVMDRRFRADVRTSDWPARLARAARYVMPHRWRGTRREREIKSFLLDFARRAAFAAKDDYDRWNEAMQRLHLMAAENRLRGMALAEIRMLAEPGQATAASA